MNDSEKLQPTQEWIITFKPNPQARIRLFCFPYAGGSASVFRSWADEAPAEIELCAVQLPGRERRWREPRFTSLSDLIEPLALGVHPFLNIPFAFFGHSMGALISFELARRLRLKNAAQPLHLFVSGRRAPQLSDPKPPIHALPDAEFIDSLRSLNGTPEEILQNQDALPVFLPILRADFAINETYTYHIEEPLDCPIWAFGGTEDKEAGQDALEPWDAQTDVQFAIRMFPGDHFFLHRHRAVLTRLIYHQLMSSLKR